MTLPKEAIEAGLRITLSSVNMPAGECLHETDVREILEAAIPFLPIAGEGKVAAATGDSANLLPCPFCGGTKVDLHRDQTARMSWVACVDCGLQAPSETGVTNDDAVAFWNHPPSSPGKDGGQEVEAVKPSIDTMREAAWALLRKFGWQPTARLSLHQVSEVMAAFGMNVSRGEVGCGYPDCGCCADAACEDAIKQHADFRTQTASAALVESEDYFGRLVADARVSAVKAKRKFPQPNYVTLKIAEEAGEVVRGAVHYAENRMSWEEVEGEIIQLLAMLIRFVTEGDEINGVRPPALSASQSTSREK